jgi:hypothetical protein
MVRSEGINMSNQELIDALRAKLSELHDEELGHLMDVLECEYVNRMAVISGWEDTCQLGDYCQLGTFCDIG